MLLTLRIAIFLLLVYPALLFAGSSSREEWLPIAPEELKMTSEPKAPGAPAIYLYRQVDRDDIENREFIYARIKIFTEEGRKYANIELPFLKGAWDIKDIQARTIHPDGTILDFSSSIFEKTIVKAKGLKYLAKTFTLSEVQTGSIIEYRYTRTTRSLYDSHWILSEGSSPSVPNSLYAQTGTTLCNGIGRAASPRAHPLPSRNRLPFVSKPRMSPHFKSRTSCLPPKK